jgi:phosphoglycolate phosphatase-like HAD superfamily hydrolase
MIELPGKEGVLETPITMDETNIEIVRHYDGSNIQTVLFDFDGPLSKERDGWIDIMIECNSTALKGAVPTISLDKAVELVSEDIQKTIGIPAYMQMERLAKMITDRGGIAADTQKYKDDYNQKLVVMVSGLHKQIESGEISHHQVRPDNVLNLLRYLKKHNPLLNLQIASGTDTDAVKDSVKILCLNFYFKDNSIIGSGSTDDPKQCAKELIIKKLTQQGLKAGELLCFEDGFPGLLYTYQARGIGIGVLTPDVSKYENQFTLDEKRDRLINGGAHIIVKDYTHASKLVEIIFKNSRDVF